MENFCFNKTRKGTRFLVENELNRINIERIFGRVGSDNKVDIRIQEI